MTTYLYSLLTATTQSDSLLTGATQLDSLLPNMPVGAAKMAQTDPTGWILTGISVFVVFSALIILYFLYSASGKILSKPSTPSKPKVKKTKGEDNVIAAAIAMALEAECGDCTPVAIATALHLHLSNAVHDIEPGIVTIRRINNSAWGNPQRNFRNTR